MKHKFFAIPVLDSDQAEAELNRFCDQHRIINIEKQVVSNAIGSHWAVCVSWLEQDGEIVKSKTSSSAKKPKVDYRDVLSPELFEQFSRLRNVRSAVAEQEGIPVYNIFTNEQLAIMVQQKITSKAELLKLEGVGQTRVEKYSDAFIHEVKQFISDETSIY